MATRIPLYDKTGDPFGYFVTQLSPEEVWTMYQAYSAYFDEWAGDFHPLDPSAWTANDALILCREEEPWYTHVEMIGDLEFVED